MFELVLIASSTTEDGKNVVISDLSDWSISALADRAKYGVFLVGEFRTAETPSSVVLATYDALTVTEWTAETPQNGRYSFTAYAFILRDEVVPSEGDIHIHTDGLLYQYVSAAWVEISLDDAITADGQEYTSGVLEVPFLGYAYSYRNQLNLEYIKQVKKDISNGASQNKLYYKRTDLDYFGSLILGAEYNWAIGLYSNYYEIVANLEAIMESGNIS